MRSYLVAGNWKMNGSNAANSQLVDGILSGALSVEQVDLLICPPFPYLAEVAAKLGSSRMMLGAQNVSAYKSGAYTGETSGSMLKDVGCSHVIVGHSERRALYGESSEVVAEKYMAAQGAGLKPILCVGETLEEREGGRTNEVLATQFNGGLTNLTPETFAKSIIAYEPVWAIGTGKTATPEMAAEAHGFLRGLAAEKFGKQAADGIRILYGGSVKPANVAGLMAKDDIDGGLVGGASLQPDSFAAIVHFDR